MRQNEKSLGISSVITWYQIKIDRRQDRDQWIYKEWYFVSTTFCCWVAAAKARFLILLSKLRCCCNIWLEINWFWILSKWVIVDGSMLMTAQNHFSTRIFNILEDFMEFMYQSNRDVLTCNSRVSPLEWCGQSSLASRNSVSEPLAAGCRMSSWCCCCGCHCHNCQHSQHWAQGRGSGWPHPHSQCCHGSRMVKRMRRSLGWCCSGYQYHFAVAAVAVDPAAAVAWQLAVEDTTDWETSSDHWHLKQKHC